MLTLSNLSLKFSNILSIDICDICTKEGECPLRLRDIYPEY